jgi:hypothetical protein
MPAAKEKDVKFFNRIGCAGAGCAVWLVCAVSGLAQTPSASERILPNSARAWVSVPNPRALDEAFNATQIGQLAADERLKPFFQDLRDQVRILINRDELRHGIKLSRFEELETGEICVAGLLPRDDAGEIQPNKHGLMLLVSVYKCKEQAATLLGETAEELRQNKATSTTEKFGDVEATVWTFPKPPHLERERHAYHAIAGDWLVASDNRELFEQVLKRIADPDAPADGSLASDTVFQELAKRTQISEMDFKPHARWYVDPFGYLDLARVLAEEDQDPETSQRSAKFAKVVGQSGFSAIKGVAGALALATSEQEMLHRVFIYAPPQEAAGENRLPKAAAILDFVNQGKLPFDPEPWVPGNAASYVTFTWNLEKVVNNIYHVVDALTDENSFENMLKSIKETNNVDVRKLVECLSNRITVASEIVEPIDAQSEKIVIGLGILKDEDFVRQQIENFFGGALKRDVVTLPDGKPITICSEEEPHPDESDPFAGDVFGGDQEEEDEPELVVGDQSGEAGDGGEDAEPDGEFLKNKFVTVHNGYVLIAGDLDFLKRVITSPPTDLKAQPDFMRVRDMLDKFVAAEQISARQFVRLDRVFEANYELIRAGKLDRANTLLARLVRNARKELERQGKQPANFNPSEMPDYHSAVAPSLGISGWVIESVDDGWRLTSCMLRREAAPNIIPVGTQGESDDSSAPKDEGDKTASNGK